MDVATAGPWAVVLIVVLKTIIDALKWYQESRGKSAIEKDQAAIRIEIDRSQERLKSLEDRIPIDFAVIVASLDGRLIAIKESIDKRREAALKLCNTRNEALEREFRESTSQLYERQLEQAQEAIRIAATVEACLSDNNKILVRIEPRLI